MGDLSKARIVVVGAGVLGLSCAAVLKQRGARVEVIDDRPDESNASAVAAGMIAPALEAALEGGDAGRAELYREAASRWPAFAEAFGVNFWRDGADWLGSVDPLAERLETLGFAFVRRSVGLFVPSESRVAPRQALVSLGAGLTRAAATVTEAGQYLGRTGIDAVVIASGWRAAALRGMGGLADHVTPVKGQILVLDGSGFVTRTTRDEGVYLVPGGEGVIVGATMETGRSDTEVEMTTVRRLRAAAAALVPALADAPLKAARAGVRGATPDGLPLVGATSVERTFVALAPRRNGWLLAPLVAETVAAAISGEPPPPFAEAFRPDRFDQA